MNREKRYVIVLVPYAPSPTLPCACDQWHGCGCRGSLLFSFSTITQNPFQLVITANEVLVECLLASKLAALWPLVMRNTDKHLKSLTCTLGQQNAELWHLMLKCFVTLHLVFCESIPNHPWICWPVSRVQPCVTYLPSPVRKLAAGVMSPFLPLEKLIPLHWIPQHTQWRRCGACFVWSEIIQSLLLHFDEIHYTA